jgi:hypothetical protein
MEMFERFTSERLGGDDGNSLFRRFTRLLEDECQHSALRKRVMSNGACVLESDLSSVNF